MVMGYGRYDATLGFLTSRHMQNCAVINAGVHTRVLTHTYRYVCAHAHIVLTHTYVCARMHTHTQLDTTLGAFT